LPGSDIVIVFVHGVLGDSETTWGTGKAYWPFMLFEDSDGLGLARLRP